METLYIPFCHQLVLLQDVIPLAPDGEDKGRDLIFKSRKLWFIVDLW